MIRGISGGQKRRVSLGKGLITGPMCVFLDEITSGLSATDSVLVIQGLKNFKQALKATIICVIHQPRLSVFNKFDNLILLSAGKMVYQGEVKKALKYFENLGYKLPELTNPADYYLDIITPDAPGANPDLFISHYEKTYVKIIINSFFFFLFV